MCATSLHVEQLVCWRGRRLLFSGLDVAVAPGGALLLSGPNGSGKTSLLRILAGLLPAWRGHVMWRHHPDAQDAAFGRVRYIGHEDGVKARLTVGEDMRFWARLWGGDDMLARSALAMMGMDGLIDRQGRQLSAGQRRRLALARLLVAPSGGAWLLDEPMTALDRDGQGLLMDRLAWHRERGGIVVISTHDDFAAPDVDRIEMTDYRGRDAEYSYFGEVYGDEPVP